jgi:hypothetical protein
MRIGPAYIGADATCPETIGGIPGARVGFCYTNHERRERHMERALHGQGFSSGTKVSLEIRTLDENAILVRLRGRRLVFPQLDIV